MICGKELLYSFVGQRERCPLIFNLCLVSWPHNQTHESNLNHEGPMMALWPAWFKIQHSLEDFGREGTKIWFEGTRGRQWHPTPVLLPGNSHGRRSLVGCCLWGRTELDTTESTQQQQQQHTQLIFRSRVHKDSFLSTSLPTLVISFIFYNNHSKRY